MDDVPVPIFGIIGIFGSVSYIASVIADGIRTRQQATLTREFTHKLLDLVSSAEQLTELMNSDGGKRLLASISGAQHAATAHTRILRALQSGLVLGVLGSEDDERQLSAFMQCVRDLPVRATPIDPARIWVKAQLLRRWDVERRITAPLDRMQPIEIAGGIACLAFLLYRTLPFIF